MEYDAKIDNKNIDESNEYKKKLLLIKFLDEFTAKKNIYIIENNKIKAKA